MERNESIVVETGWSDKVCSVMDIFKPLANVMSLWHTRQRMTKHDDGRLMI